MNRFFKNISLKAKLITGFGLTALLALVVGIVGIVCAGQLSAANENMYLKNTLPMENMASLYDALAGQRICLNNMAFFRESDPDFAVDERKSLSEKESTFESVLVTYKSELSSDEEESYYNMISTLYAGDFAEIKTNILSAFDSGDIAAMESGIRQMDEKGSEISDYIDKSFSLNSGQAKDVVDGNKALYQSAALFLMITMAVAFAGSIALAFFNAAVISKPMTRIMDIARKVGETGSLQFDEQAVKDIHNDAQFKDEVGRTANAFSLMMDGLLAKTTVLETVADGDLTPKVTLMSDDDTIGNAIARMLDNLNDMFGEINNAAEQVSSGAGQIADGAQSLAQATTEQSSTVEQLSQSISSIAEKTRENADIAVHAAELSDDIKKSAEQGSTQMNRMIDAVKAINDSSRSIEKVIKVIDDIAFQTNILALNAAVEAARAGQHGKGFAVVAEEVRSLAAKSAAAAKDTGNLISDSVEKAELGVLIAQETSGALDKIVTEVNESTQLMNDIANSSKQQSGAISDINKGIDQVAMVVQQNSATAEQSAASSEEMSSQSTMLSQLVARFKLRDMGMGLPMPSPSTSYGKQPASPLPPAGNYDKY